MSGHIFNPYRAKACGIDGENNDAMKAAAGPEMAPNSKPTFRRMINPYLKVKRRVDADPIEGSDIDESLLVAALEEVERKLGLPSAAGNHANAPTDFDKHSLDDATLLQTLASAEACLSTHANRKRPATTPATVATPPRKMVNPYSRSQFLASKPVVTPVKAKAVSVDEFDESCLDDESLLRALEHAERSLEQRPTSLLPVVSPAKTPLPSRKPRKFA